jgi:uroporphyrinogen-III synthase
MTTGALDGVRIVAFEARRADELAQLFARHGAQVLSAPALREVPLGEPAEVRTLVEALRAGTVGATILLTGVGTRALADAAAGFCDDFPALLGGVPIVARGPKPVSALRQLGVVPGHVVPRPYTWRETLAVVDGLGLPPGATVAVQEYGEPPTTLVRGLEARGLRVQRVPVYRWALPDDTTPLRRGIDALCGGAAEVAVFTSAVQIEHAFRVAPDAAALREALGRVVVASIGPVCSEALEAHGVTPTLEADPPKMGPLVAAVAGRGPTLRDAARAHP